MELIYQTRVTNLGVMAADFFVCKIIITCNTCYLRDLIPGSFLGTGFTGECELFFCTSNRGVEPAGIVF